MNALADGATLNDIVDDFPGYACNHKKIIEEWIVYFESELVEEVEKEAWPIGDLEEELIECKQDEIASWLSKNVRKPRMFKQKQLYIRGETNMGKSTLVNNLMRYLKIYEMPKNQWMNGYKNNFYDLIVMDEFEGQYYKISFLNKFLEGGNMWLDIKFGVPYKKTDNPPVLILSNYHLRDTYSRVSESILDTIKGRVDVIDINEYIDLFQ